MKTNLKIRKQTINKFAVRSLRFAICISLLTVYCLLPTLSSAQKSETTLGLTFLKKFDHSKTVTANVKAKNEQKKFVAVAGLTVNFYTLKDEEVVSFGQATSDAKGNAQLMLPKDLVFDKDGYFSISAKIENNPQYEDAEENIYYREAELTLKLNPIDTAQLVTATVTEMNMDGKEIPVKDAEIMFYAQRLFGDMPASEENAVTTDENGEAVYVFPKSIPGDTLGKLIIAAKIEDNELYGNLESRSPVQWGMIVPKDEDPFSRALMQPKAPLQMIITISVLYGGVWCTYFLVFFLLWRIKKEKIILNN